MGPIVFIYFQYSNISLSFLPDPGSRVYLNLNMKLGAKLVTRRTPPSLTEDSVHCKPGNQLQQQQLYTITTDDNEAVIETTTYIQKVHRTCGNVRQQRSL